MTFCYAQFVEASVTHDPGMYPPESHPADPSDLGIPEDEARYQELVAQLPDAEPPF